MDISQSLDKVFTIACDSYGLSSTQLENLIESSNVISDSIHGYNREKKSTYIDSYNAIMQVLANCQKCGLFELEAASNIFKALLLIKQHITESEVIAVDLLENNNKYLSNIITNNIINCIYSNIDLKRINVAVADLNKFLSTEVGVAECDIKNYNTILNAINKAQSKGKFTLQQANNTVELLLTIKDRLQKNQELQKTQIKKQGAGVQRNIVQIKDL